MDAYELSFRSKHPRSLTSREVISMQTYVSLMHILALVKSYHSMLDVSMSFPSRRPTR